MKTPTALEEHARRLSAELLPIIRKYLPATKEPKGNIIGVMVLRFTDQEELNCQVIGGVHLEGAIEMLMKLMLDTENYLPEFLKYAS